jgi:signal transduction histidine kinase
LLSLICAAIRYSPAITGITCGLDALSFSILYLSLPAERRDTAALAGMLILLAWVTWAAAALARLLHRIGEQLEQNQSLLEERIAERTRELQESQAQVLHQEKMAAFGLLAAGIAHEVGNPLTSISTLIQLLERRDLDDYTRERLGLVNTQLTRIQTILRELVAFGRPASDIRGRVNLRDIVDEALGIAKYYKGVKSREVRADIPADLPTFIGVRDQLVQVFLNLVLNAIDATGKGGSIVIRAHIVENELVATVTDNGPGIDSEHKDRLFRPYFTTKKHGTGLGLFVTRKLIVAHGGSITFSSSLAGGTTFRLVFPLAQGSVALAAEYAAG